MSSSLPTLMGAGASGDYEAYATMSSTSGSQGTTGTYNSWVNLGNTQTWGITRTSTGQAKATINIQIRKSGTTTTLTSANISLTRNM